MTWNFKVGMYENNYTLDACLEARNIRRLVRIRDTSKKNNDAMLMYAFMLVIYYLREIVRSCFEEFRMLCSKNLNQHIVDLFPILSA